MAITADEIPESRQLSGNPPSGRRVHKIVGTTDMDLAVAYAIAASPAVWYSPYGALYRQDCQVEDAGWNQFLATIPYTTRTFEAGSFTFNFDSTGGTARIYAAKQHISSWNSSGSVATDYYKSAIGVVNEGGQQKVEGCEIVIPALKLSYTLRQPAGLITENYAKILASITGTVNSSTFRGFSAGELLFAGATGSDGTQAPAECTYTFIASAHATLTIGNITFFKAGHAYAWVEFTPAVVSNVAATNPLRVHVEGVYSSVDFATYLGWA